MGLIVVACGLSDSIKVVPTDQFEKIMNYDMAVVLKKNLSHKTENKVFNKVKNHRTIKDAVKVFSSDVKVKHDKKDVEATMMVPDRNQVFEQCISFRDSQTGQKICIPQNGAIISEKAARLLGIKQGDVISLEIYGEKTVKIEIAYITETYLYHYIYMSKRQYEMFYGRDMDINQILGIYYDENIDNIYDFNSNIGSEFIKDKNILGVAFMQDMVDETKDMVEALNIIVYVLLISAAILTFVIIYNLNSINITQRCTELATLKVLGFHDKEVSEYIFRENIILTGVGIVLGIFIGKFLHFYIIDNIEMDIVMFSVIISKFSYALSASVTVIFTGVVNFIMGYKIKKIDMLGSLKCVE